MKRILFFANILVLIIACKPKNEVTTVLDFDVTISRVESHKVWLDIFPKDEFLRYNLDCMPASEWNLTNVEQYKQGLDEIMQLYTEQQYKRVTQEGAYLSSIPTASDTEYCLIITGLDANRKTTDVRVERFRSAQEHLSGFTLSPDSIRMKGGVISIHPQDTSNTYFWDYELKSEINIGWNYVHSGWFYYDVEYYYQLDFLVKNKGLFSKGEDSEDIFLYYSPLEIQDGDTITLLAVGYDETGETSLAYMPFWIVYHSDTTTASTAVEAVKDGYESVFRDYATSSKRSTAKAASSSQKWLQESSFVRKDRYIPQHIRSRQR